MRQINEKEFMRFLWEREYKDLIILIELGHSEVLTNELINEFEEWKKNANNK